MKVLSGKALVKNKDLIVSSAHCINGEYIVDTLSIDKKKSERIVFSKDEIREIVKAWNKIHKGLDQ